ncbi:MAG: tetratricopeptide repeat protein [Myxococcota bacterium]|nr:tetratricopeptide repeat protein [Myxococcota bacterium]
MRWLVGVLALAWGSGGCASLSNHDPALSERAPHESLPTAESARPDASVDYDVLVGELAAQEARFEEARDAYLRASHKDPHSAYIHRKLARLALKLDDIDTAAVHANRAFALEPDDEDTRLFLARIHRIRLDLASVESVLLGADGLPVSPRAVVLLYQIYLERSRLSEALQITRRLVDEHPEMLDGHMALATVYEHLGRRGSAVQVIRDALDHHPDRPILYSRLARMLRAMDDRAAEIALYREVLVKRPDHFGTLVSLGEAQIAINDLDGALDTYARIIAAHPDDLQAIRRYASLEFAAGRYEQAAARLEAAFARHPEHFELAYSLGQVVRNMGDDDRALKLFSLVPEYHPAFGESRLQLASIYEDREDYEAALVEVEKLRILRPSRALAFHTAELLTRIERFDDALELLHAMREESPDDDEVLYQLGVCYGTARRVDEALEYMRLALESNPDNPHALNYIGYTWAERGENLDEAEHMILRALDQRPNDGYITDSLGWVYYMRALPLVGTAEATRRLVFLERARAQLFHAAELTGGDPVISEHLGDVHMALDERRRAFEFYQEAVRLERREDEQPDLLEKIDRLRRELNEQ